MKRFQSFFNAVIGLAAALTFTPVANANEYYTLSVDNSNLELFTALLEDQGIPYDVLNEDNAVTVLTVDRSQILSPQLLEEIVGVTIPTTSCVC